MTPGRSARVVALLALGSGVVSCARQGAPPGGPEDRRPPVVISVEPDTFARVDPELDRLRIRFNERISRQATGGSLDQAVEISPEVPELEVKHDRQGLDIHIPGGLRPGLTYRVRITPAIRDMFGNPMAVPFEWM
ncbi:MAG: Ig-like domain-containing protein, partial [Gemmatimonadota bacterium]